MEQNQTASGRPLYTLVIPAYREEDVIESTLRTVETYLRETSIWDVTEVVVVAAEAGDRTQELARANSGLFRYFQLVEPGAKVGKGRDVKVGVEAAKGSYILFTDADLATPIRHVKPALEALENGSDMVIGVRDLWREHKTLFRKLLSVGSNWIVRIVLLPTVPDSQCGFKGFTKEASATLFSRLTIFGWGFDMELLAIARKHKLKIRKLYIPDWADPKVDSGLVGEPTWKAGLRTLRELFKIRWQVWKGMYK